jgi:hypothetical protein
LNVAFNSISLIKNEACHLTREANRQAATGMNVSLEISLQAKYLRITAQQKWKKMNTGECGNVFLYLTQHFPCLQHNSAPSG